METNDPTSLRMVPPVCIYFFPYQPSSFNGKRLELLDTILDRKTENSQIHLNLMLCFITFCYTYLILSVLSTSAYF